MPPVLRDLVSAFRAHGGAVSTQANLVAELAVWAATADGVLESTELSELAAMLRAIPGLEAFDDIQAHKLAERLMAQYPSEDTINTRITEIALSIDDRELRRASYRLAVWSAARDGNFSEEEAAFLENLQDCLEISDEDADELVKSVVDVKG